MPGKATIGCGCPPSFQNLNEQFTDERLSGGRAFDQNAVTGFDASRMFHQNFCKFLYASIGHRNLPIQIIALMTALKLFFYYIMCILEYTEREI